MKQIVAASLLAVMANPALAHLEILRSDLSMDQTERAATRAALDVGAGLVGFNRSDDGTDMILQVPHENGDASGGFLTLLIREAPDGAVWLSYPPTEVEQGA